jgi:hypothetical protein
LILWSRFARTWKSLFAIAGILSLLTLLPTTAIYGYELHRRYSESTSQPRIPNVDFSMMAIATKPVNVTAYGTTSKVQVKAWERCALGVTTCDKRPRTVEAICLGGGQTVLIDEGAWPAFQRIPDEDLPGISGQPKNMNLCSSR